MDEVRKSGCNTSQQTGVYITPDHSKFITQVQICTEQLKKVTYETGRVVVSDGLGIAISLQYGVSLHNLILQAAL